MTRGFGSIDPHPHLNLDRLLRRHHRQTVLEIAIRPRNLIHAVLGAAQAGHQTTPAPLPKTDNNAGLKNVLVDGAIGNAVGAGIGGLRRWRRT